MSRLVRRVAAVLGGWLCAVSAASALEVNAANQAELESLKGIGTQLSQRLIDARAERPFADWADLMRRVPGVRAASARRLSAAGLRVQGTPYEAAGSAMVPRAGDAASAPTGASAASR